MKLTTHKLAFIAPLLIVALIISGCDQNAFDENLGIPDGDGVPYVEFADNPDTLAFFKSDTAELAVDNTTASNDSIIVDWAITGGDAVLDTHFEVPPSFRESNGANVEQEIRIDPSDPRALDVDNLPPNIAIEDTLENGIIIATRTIDGSQSFETTFNEADQTGQVRIGTNQFRNSVNTGTIALQGIEGTDDEEPRSVIVELTDAQTSDGDPVQAGRQGTTPNGNPGTVQNRITVLFGQADIIATGPVALGEVAQRTSEPYVGSFLIGNLGAAFGSGADLSSTLTNFQISGSDSFTLASAVEGIELAPNDLIEVVVLLDASETGTNVATLSFNATNDFDQRTVTVDLSAVVVD